MKTCSATEIKTGICGMSAKWKHPRWPTGTFCDEHKETLEKIWPDDWLFLDEEELK